MVGKTFGTYRILEEIGRGAMGVVYRAEDLRLGREAVLKFLSPQVLTRPEARARFEREARAASALDHPNICTIYQIGETDDGQAYLAMAYYPGQTLDKFLERGELSTVEAAAMVLQIAGGLTYAHGRGIVHRDVKPANVIVDAEGRSKLLDFGLAKVVDEASSFTAEGVVGTPAYLAPELLQGEVADPASDLWSLAAITYEMLTGQRPFGSVLGPALFHRIVQEEPEPPSALVPSLPGEVDRVLARGLAKNPGERHGSALDFAVELYEALGLSPPLVDPSSASSTSALGSAVGRPSGAAPSPPARGGWGPWLLGTALLALAAASGYWISALRERPAEAPGLARTQLITRDEGREVDPDLSPDGRHLVYTSDSLGNPDIWIRQIASGRSVPLTGDHEGADESAALSPDGDWIAFVSDRDGGGVFLMPAVGGPPRRIARLRVLVGTGTSLWVPSLAWHPEGDRLVVSGTEDDPEPRLVFPDGSAPVALPPAALPAGAPLVEPALSPDGRWLAMVELAGVGTTVSRIWLGELEMLESVGRGSASRPRETSPWRPLTEGTFHDEHPFWGPRSDRLHFVSDRGGPRDLWSLELDSRGHPRGDARPLTTGVGVGSATFSADGGLLVYSKVESTSNLWTLPLGEEQAGFDDAVPITSENHVIEFVDLSPSGERIVFDSNRGGNADLWWMPSEGGEPFPITRDPAHDWRPRHSPDGSELVFYSLRSGNRDIWKTSAEGGGAVQLTRDPARDWMPAFSADGRHVFFETNRTGRRSLWRVLADGSDPRPVFRGRADAASEDRGNDLYPVPSPDGRWLAFAGSRGERDDRPTRDLYVVALDAEARAEGTARVLTGSGRWRILLPFAWSDDSTTVYYQARKEDRAHPNIWATGLDGRTRAISDFRSARLRLFESFTLHGERLIFPVREERADLWMAEVEWR